MEILNLPGYTEEEKHNIARRYLLPKQVAEHGLKPEQLKMTDAALTKTIQEYTREAGVRNLERELAAVCRAVARKVAEGEEAGKSLAEIERDIAALQTEMQRAAEALERLAGDRGGGKVVLDISE